MSSLLSPDEVQRYLEIEPKALDDLVRTGKLHSYRLGGSYLRFRKDEVEALRAAFLSKKAAKKSRSFFAILRDFWVFNNFYIISLIIAIAVIYFIFKH